MNIVHDDSVHLDEWNVVRLEFIGIDGALPVSTGSLFVLEVLESQILVLHSAFEAVTIVEKRHPVPVFWLSVSMLFVIHRGECQTIAMITIVTFTFIVGELFVGVTILIICIFSVHYTVLKNHITTATTVNTNSVSGINANQILALV